MMIFDYVHYLGEAYKNILLFNLLLYLHLLAGFFHKVESFFFFHKRFGYPKEQFSKEQKDKCLPLLFTIFWTVIGFLASVQQGLSWIITCLSLFTSLLFLLLKLSHVGPAALSSCGCLGLFHPAQVILDNGLAFSYDKVPRADLVHFLPQIWN